jgi:hypothetical protein
MGVTMGLVTNTDGKSLAKELIYSEGTFMLYLNLNPIQVSLELLNDQPHAREIQRQSIIAKELV